MSVQDQTADAKEENRFRNKWADFIKLYVKEKKTHFSQKELEAIALIYFKFERESHSSTGFITRFQFRSIFHITFNMPEDTFIDRVMVGLDKGISPTVTLETWFNTMSLFLRGSLEEKINYCFVCYDVMGDGFIKRNFMTNLMKTSIIKSNIEDIEEAVNDLVDLIIQKMDIDRDGSISFNDYRVSVLKQPILLQCLGQVIPDRDSIYSFLMTFTDQITKY